MKDEENGSAVVKELKKMNEHLQCINVFLVVTFSALWGMFIIFLIEVLEKGG